MNVEGFYYPYILKKYYTHRVLRICWISRIWNSWAEASSSESKQRCIVKTVYVYVTSRGVYGGCEIRRKSILSFRMNPSMTERISFGILRIPNWFTVLNDAYQATLVQSAGRSTPIISLADHNEDPDWVSSTQKIIITRKMPQKVT